MNNNNIEKIITGLEYCYKRDYGSCEKCPYFDNDCSDQLMYESLILINELIHDNKLLCDIVVNVFDYLNKKGKP